MPPLIEYCDAHDGVVFLIWDEGESTLQIPFLALGARVKPGYVSQVELDTARSSKRVEMIFNLPVLAKVSASHDFGDLLPAAECSLERASLDHHFGHAAAREDR